MIGSYSQCELFFHNKVKLFSCPLLSAIFSPVLFSSYLSPYSLFSSRYLYLLPLFSTNMKLVANLALIYVRAITRISIVHSFSFKLESGAREKIQKRKIEFRLPLYLTKHENQSLIYIVVRKMETDCLKIVSISKMNESVDSNQRVTSHCMLSIGSLLLGNYRGENSSLVSLPISLPS